MKVTNEDAIAGCYDGGIFLTKFVLAKKRVVSYDRAKIIDGGEAMTENMPKALMSLIEQGESLTVEFKKSTTDITKDVYETVCAFSNREGGHIFLGINDDGKILGVQEDKIDDMKKNFVTTANNEQKLNPPMYLDPIAYNVDEKTIIYIRVPVSTNVCHCNGKIYDRIHEADIDITNHSDEVYRLYSKKSASHFVNRVTGFGIDSLRHDVIERARKMTRVRNQNHPWLDMSDEELLRTAGLLLTDEFTHKEGVTVAAILLFGKDSTIMSVLPQHKTDAIYRVYDTDRYDDRDVVITNLIDSYDRLMEFGKKHLNDTFHLDGIQSVSARDHILREVISNLLAHRDFSSGYVAKLVIEQDKLYTENANLSHGYGALNLMAFDAYAKNPPISKVFREIGLADELGSGMRNTYKYTRMYSNAEPQFIEGDVFKTIVPLSEAASMVKVGPVDVNSVHDVDVNYGTGHDRGHDSGHDSGHDRGHDEKKERLLEYCTEPRSRVEMQEYLSISSRGYFKKVYLEPMLREGLLVMTIPDKPKSKNQRYVVPSE